MFTPTKQNTTSSRKSISSSTTASSVSNAQRKPRASRGSFGYIPRRRRASSGAGFLPSLSSAAAVRGAPGRGLRMMCSDPGATATGGSPKNSIPSMGARPSLYDTIIMLKVRDFVLNACCLVVIDMVATYCLIAHT